MSGRTLYHRNKWLINCAVILVSILPIFLRRFIFNAFSSTGSIFGVLIRYVFLKSLAKSVGDNVYIARWCTFKNIENLVIGSNVSFHEYCYLDAKGGIDIGNDVSIAHQTSILSFEHSFLSFDNPIKYQPLVLKKTTIDDDVWVGAGCRILAGAAVGKRTVIAANSVVKNQVGNGIYAGAPCKKIREL